MNETQALVDTAKLAALSDRLAIAPHRLLIAGR